MTPVLIGKDLLLEGSKPKTEDKQVATVHIYIYVYFSLGSSTLALFLFAIKAW